MQQKAFIQIKELATVHLYTWQSLKPNKSVCQQFWSQTVTQNSPFSSLVVAVTVARTHFVYPHRDDQAELAWVAWLNIKTVYPQTVTHLSTNPARRRVTSLICPRCYQ